MKLKYTSKNRGLTLIEALIWFAIFAAVVAGIFALYSSTRNANNASTVNKELSTIFSQTEQLFASEDTEQLASGGNSLALKLGIYPKSVKVSSDGSSISNVFGGTINITGESPSSFTVTYTHVPNGEVCANIIRAQKAVGWDSVNTVTYDKDYTITDVVALCGSNGTGTIDLDFVRANTNS